MARFYPELKDVGHYDFCPTCHKTGTYRWRGEDRGCDCELQLQLHKWYSYSGIPESYQRLGWDDWEGDPELAEMLRVYVTDPRFRDEGLFLWGDPGTGKTMLALLVLKEMIKTGVRCYAVTFNDMIEEFTKGWADNAEKRWFERHFKLTRALLLDDLGRELRSRSTLPQTTFDNLLRTRVQAGRPTIITTNLSSDEVGTGYGAGVLNLLWEQSLAYHLTGENWHKKVRPRKDRERDEVRPIQ